MPLLGRGDDGRIEMPLLGRGDEGKIDIPLFGRGEEGRIVVPSLPEEEIAKLTVIIKNTVIMTDRKRFQLFGLCIRVLLE